MAKKRKTSINKKNQKYWKKRSEKIIEDNLQLSFETINTSEKAFNKAVADINKRISSCFFNFLDDPEEFSIGETKDLLNEEITKEEWLSIKSNIKNINDEDLQKLMYKMLDSPAYKARITRLEALKADIEINAKIAGVELKNSCDTLFLDVLKEAYYKNGFEIQKGLNIEVNFSKISTERLNALLKENFLGSNYSDRIWKNTDLLTNRLKETLIKGLLTGKDLRSLSKDLEEEAEYGKYAAERLVRTETTYYTNKAEMESYKEVGIEKYVFIATLDNRTSVLCQEHDGEVFEVTDGQAGDNIPPLHPYCRSTTIAYFDKKTLNNMQRRSGAKTFDFKTYDEWLNDL